MPLSDPDLDLLLKKIEKGVDSPADRLAVDRQLRSEPSPDGVFAPISLMHPDTVPPVAYVLHNFTTLCLGCGSEHRHSEVYALNHLRLPGGTVVRNLVPAPRPEWNVPLRVHNLTSKTTPLCHECSDLASDWLRTLPAPPVPLAVMKAAARPAEPTEGRSSSDVKAKPKAKFGLDDL